LKTSRYFSNLTSSYRAELDDLRTDSEGKDVLRQRLATKRKQMKQLLPMMKFAPEMVAVAFHGGFAYKNRKVLEALVAKEGGRLTDWAVLSGALTIEAWAQELVDVVLTDAEGPHFLATTVGLEFLHKHGKDNSAPADDATDPNEEDLEHEQEVLDHDHNDDYLSSDDVITHEGETNEFDLDKAGADFLAEQGFDRKE
jgi:hypothetical protein